MADTDDADGQSLNDAVTTFLSEADAAFEEYEKGYTDADMVLRRLEPAIEQLRDAADEE